MLGQYQPLSEEEILAKAESTRMEGETIEAAVMRIKFDEQKRRDEELIAKTEEAEREARARKAREQARFEAQINEAKDQVRIISY